MPDFNFKNPAVVAYHLSSLRFWLNRGLDGFRLDAVPHLIENSATAWNDQPESRALTKQLQDLIKGYEHRTVVCEATAEPKAYGDPAVCGGAFAFGLERQIVAAARGDTAAAQAVAGYYRQASPTMASFLSNHDIFAGRRLWDQFGGNAAQLKLAAATYLLLPGTPYIYYGEEVGQAGVDGLPADEPLRSPMSWTPDAARAGFTTGRPFRPVAPNVTANNVQTQAADPRSILNFYKAMLTLRNTVPSIARGSFENSEADGQIVSWQRRLGDETTVVLINYGLQAAEADLQALPARARLQALYPADDAPLRVGSGGRARVALEPQSVRVLRVQR
jgi:glycosidase